MLVTIDNIPYYLCCRCLGRRSGPVLSGRTCKRRLGEVYNGQPKKKPNVAVREPARSSRKLVEVYNGDILYPTAITNVANNCHISAIVQCLSSHLLLTNSLQVIPVTNLVPSSLEPRLSIPDFVSQLFFSRLRDKIRNGKPGFEANLQQRKAGRGLGTRLPSH